MIYYGIAAFCLLFLAWFAIGIRRMGQLSHGPKIDPRPGQALLLIDLQTIFWNADTYDQTEKSKAEAAILAEVSRAKSNGEPVIAIRQEWSIPSTKFVARTMMKGQAIEGTPGTDLAAPFRNLADEVMTKRVQDAFETGELDQLLGKLNIGTLRIIGLDGNYCVAKTALSARLRGYTVEVVSAAILAADKNAYQKTVAKLVAEGANFV